jgi:hypothetical protein
VIWLENFTTALDGPQVDKSIEKKSKQFFSECPIFSGLMKLAPA